MISFRTVSVMVWLRIIGISLMAWLGSQQVLVIANDPTLVGLLRHLKARVTLEPNAVVDVGANFGDWSRSARQLFPNAKILMVEATPRHDTNLQAAVNEIGNAEYK